MYPEKILAPLYRNLLRTTRGRGAHTLAKLDCCLFNTIRKVPVGRGTHITISLPPDPHYFGYLIKSHETHISRVIQMLLKDGDTFVDVGANIGYFTMYAALAVGASGRVFCLEPEENNYNLLATNCASLKASGYTCEIYKLAASATNGNATLNIHRFSTYHAIEDEFYHLDEIQATESVGTVRLDDWAEEQGLKRIALLKIDTEGHEPKVLEGARRLFEARRVGFTVLECQSPRIGAFVNEFCEAFDLHQLIWDGQRWDKAKLQNVTHKTDCLISTHAVRPESLC
jgi:FkbM family methyltransferase